MSLYTRARKHIDMDRVKEIHEEKIKERINKIALQEKEYLLYFTQNTVPKYYDWRTGKFNENSLEEINKLVCNRLEKLDDALSEGMTSKDFKYLYGGVITYDILSINPTAVSSTFAQDCINASSEVTSHMFGPNFPGSHINSIGDFSPQSLSKADINAMAVPTPAGDAIAWNPFDQTLPTNYQLGNSSPLSSQSSSSLLDYTATQMVSRGETTDTHTDIYYTPNISQTDDVITLQAGHGDYQNLDAGDLMRLTGLYVANNVTKPNSMYADADGHLKQFDAPELYPMPYGYDSQPPDPEYPDENVDWGEPVDVVPVLRTYNNKSAGDQITFDWEFNPGNDNVSNPNNTAENDGDYDAGAWVYINGDNTFYKLANIYDHDDIRIGDDDYYQELEIGVRDEGDSRQDDNAGRKQIRPEFRTGGSGKTSGSFSYTVKSGDIDSNGNFKMWILMNLINYKSESLRITGLTGTDTTKRAAGKLGKTTAAYNLGYRVQTPTELRKLLRGQDLDKFKVNKKNKKNKKKDKFAKKYGLPDDYLDRLSKVAAYYTNNVGNITVPMGLGTGTMGVKEKMDELMIKAFEKQGFTKKQIETIQKNKLLKITSKRVKEPEEKERTRTSKRTVQKSRFGVQPGGGGTRDIGMPKQKTRFGGTRDIGMSKQKTRIGVQPGGGGTRGIQVPSQKQFTLPDKGDLSKNLNDKYGYETTEEDKWMDNYADQVARGEEPVPPIPRGNAVADPVGDLMTVGPVAVAAAKALIGTVGLAAGSAITKGARVLDQFAKWWNKGKNVRIKDEDSADLFQLFADDIAQRQGIRGPGGQGGWNPFRGMPGYGTAKSKLNPRIRAINKARRAQGKPELSMDKINPGGAQSGPSPSVRQAGRVLTKPVGPAQGARNESYDLIVEQVDPDDKFFQELQKVIVKLKKPEQVEKLSKFLKKVSKAKEKSESRNAEENNSNSNALYPGQPSPNGFPDTPPPQLAPNGYHPEFGKRSNRYRRLDPISAKTMDKVGTDDPETNKQVAAAAADSKPKKLPPGAVKKYARRNVVKKESNNLYTRSTKYIDMNRVKELREEKIKKQKIYNLVERQLEIAAELKEIEKPVDWRRELEEGMTTSGMGMINLEPGGDVDLENVTKTATPGTDGG